MILGSFMDSEGEHISVWIAWDFRVTSWEAGLCQQPSLPRGCRRGPFCKTHSSLSTPLQIPTAQSGEVYLDLKSIHLSPLQSQGRAVPICSEIRPSGCLYIRETEIRDDINILFLL